MTLAVHSLVRLNISRAEGVIAFHPGHGPGDYHVYWLPYDLSGLGGTYTVRYFNDTSAQFCASNKPCSQWAAAHGLDAAGQASGAWHTLPEATYVREEYRSGFEARTEMEMVATDAEVRALVKRVATEAGGLSPFVVFPEDRTMQIRMQDFVPHRWVQRPASDVAQPQLALAGQPGEFLIFQLGVISTDWPGNSSGAQPSSQLDMHFNDLRADAGGVAVPASALNCFNFGGIDSHGQSFNKTVFVRPREVLALWCGIQLPLTLQNGSVSGTLELLGTATGTAGGSSSLSVHLRVAVGGEAVLQAGDNEPWRMSRVRWLDSTAGISTTPAFPFTPVQLDATAARLSILGRRMTLDPRTGLPQSIECGGGVGAPFTPDYQPVLRGAAGVQLTVFRDGLPVVFEPAGPTKWEYTAGTELVTWTSEAHETGVTAAAADGRGGGGGGLLWQTQGSLESDGFASFDVAVHNRDNARTDVLSGSTFLVPLSLEASPFAMGFELRGGARPERLKWGWLDHIGQGNNKIWVGGAHAGVKLTLLGTGKNWSQFDEHWTISKDDIPLAWGGDDLSGGCVLQTINGTGGGAEINCTAGETTIAAGARLNFRFHLLITPLKPLRNNRWGQRHFQVRRSIVYR
jgi:hypothetical protein